MNAYIVRGCSIINHKLQSIVFVIYVVCCIWYWNSPKKGLYVL